MNNFSTNVPLYVLVQKEIIKLIDNWDHDKPLPSEEKLATEMGVSRSTIREAIQELVNSGVLLKKHGIGTFIRENYKKVTTGLHELRGVHNIIEAMNMEVSMKLQKYDIINNNPEVAEAFEISKEENVLQILQVYSADNRPVMVGISYINPAIIPDSFEEFGRKVVEGGEKGDFLFKVLERNTNEYVQYAFAKIEAITTEREIADMLEIEEMAPLIRLKTVHYSARDYPLIYSIDYIDTRSFALHILRRRKF